MWTALTRVADAGDLMTREQFADFELTLDWKLAEGGTARYVSLPKTPTRRIRTGPKCRCSTTRATRTELPLTLAGAVYGLYPAQPGIVHPAASGLVRIVARGAHVEHWLDGTQIAAYGSQPRVAGPGGATSSMHGPDMAERRRTYRAAGSR